MKKLIFLFLVSISQSACSNERASLNSWVEKNIDSESEILLCKSDIGGDYFFTARKGDVLKTGYQVNVTSDTNKPLSFVLSWNFKNANNEDIGKKTQENTIKNSYVKLNDEIYVEDISYKEIYIENVSKIIINLGIKKYIDSEQIPSKDEIGSDTFKLINLCEANLEQVDP